MLSGILVIIGIVLFVITVDIDLIEYCPYTVFEWLFVFIINGLRLLSFWLIFSQIFGA